VGNHHEPGNAPLSNEVEIEDAAEADRIFTVLMGDRRTSPADSFEPPAALAPQPGSLVLIVGDYRSPLAVRAFFPEPVKAHTYLEVLCMRSRHIPVSALQPGFNKISSKSSV